MAEKRSKKKGILKALVFLLLAVYAVFMMVDMQVTLGAKENELYTLEQQQEIQRIQNKDLKRQITSTVDDEEIERVAREQLEYVSPDEKVFIDISGS